MGEVLPLHLKGRAVPEERVDAMEAYHGDPAGRRAAFERQGWLLLKGVIGDTAVQEAREEVLAPLVEVGEVAPPASVGLATGRSDRRAKRPNLGEFWRKLSEGPRLRRVAQGPSAASLAASVLGGEASSPAFVWLRVKPSGVGGPLRHATRFLPDDGPGAMLWLPLGTIEMHEGPPFVVAGSHERQARPGQAAPSRDDLDFGPNGHTLLTARLQPGDALLIAPRTLYGAFDNRSPYRKVRVSCESLWRPSALPFAHGLEGSPPAGPDGQGYGGLATALPFDEQPPR